MILAPSVTRTPLCHPWSSLALAALGGNHRPGHPGHPIPRCHYHPGGRALHLCTECILICVSSFTHRMDILHLCVLILHLPFGTARRPAQVLRWACQNGCKPDQVPRAAHHPHGVGRFTIVKGYRVTSLHSKQNTLLYSGEGHRAEDDNTPGLVTPLPRTPGAAARAPPRRPAPQAVGRFTTGIGTDACRGRGWRSERG
jgi:hypothetical protein